MKNRIAYLDVARGIGMIFVVMGHVDFISEPLREYITSFHMPLFLIISGILLYVTKTEDRNIQEVVRNKCRTILLPYFIFSGGALLIELVRALVKNIDMTGELPRRLFQTLCLQGFSVYWFLPTLFIGELIFIKTRHKLSLGKTAGIGAGVVVVFYFAALIEKSIYHSHAGSLYYELLNDVLTVPIRGALASGYIFLGYFLGILFEKKQGVPWRDSLVGVLLLAATAIINRFTSFIDLRFLEFGNPLLFLLRTVFGSMGVILCCRGLDMCMVGVAGKVLRFFGQNSLIIMVTHLDYRVLNYSIKTAALVNGFVGSHVLYAVLTILFVFLYETVLIYIIHRMRPILKNHMFFFHRKKTQK